MNNGREIISREVEFQEIKPEDVGKVFNTPYYTEFSVNEKLNKNISSMVSCRRISKDEYVDMTTGEIKRYSINKTKTKKSFKENHRIVPKIIMGYFRGTENERHIILKYDKPMYQPELLANDIKCFLKKFKRVFSNCIYLYAKEPFNNGTWHIHFLFRIMDREDFDINEERIKKLWKKGNVVVEKIRDINRFAWKFDILKNDWKKDRLIFYPATFHPFGHSSEIKVDKEIIKYEELPKYIDEKELQFRKQSIFGYENNDGGINPIGILKYEQYKK